MDLDGGEQSLWSGARFQYKSEAKGIAACHKDADMWILVWNKIHGLSEKGIWLKVMWVKAHTTNKEKCTDTSGSLEPTEKMDELAESGRDSTERSWDRQVCGAVLLCGRRPRRKGSKSPNGSSSSKKKRHEAKDGEGKVRKKLY